MNFKPECVATAIGSFPHTSADAALEIILEAIPEIPTWPQLPKISFFEDMNNQYSRALPCYFIDEKNNKSGFNTDKDFTGELEKFYGRIIDNDLEYFALDKKHSMGFSSLVNKLSSSDKKNLLSVKGQITGPLTLGLITDIVDGKFAIYKPDLFDAIVKSSIMNSKWQINKLKDIVDDVIIFLDEPSLSVIGSGFYSVDNDLILSSFNEIIDGIRDNGGIPGMHCCGNADWDEMLKLGLGIINFDASDESITDKFLNANNIEEFLEKGSAIAWGVVPTIKDKIESVEYKEIEGNFYSLVKRLSKRGISESKIIESSIITPSCGTGTLDISLSEKAMMLTKELSNTIRGKNN
ncbi:hypothetical protein ACFL20_06635 [Spirochaetota bacterium]